MRSSNSGLYASPIELRHQLSSYNEFDPLRAVIVGSAVGSNHPEMDISMENFFTPPQDEKIKKTAVGKIPQIIVDEIQEDIAAFVQVLEQRGIEVLHPVPYDSSKEIQSPYWRSSQLYSLMPRDSFLVIGNVLLEVPSPTRARYFETFPFRHISEAYSNRGALFISAPRPLLFEEAFDVTTPSFLPEKEPLFDGANCVRLGKDIFIDINNSANHLGYRWLQRLSDHLSLGITFHPMQLGEDHADVTLVPIRPGVVLINPKKVIAERLPPQFKSWTKIIIQDLVEQPYGLSYPLASNEIGRNVLMLDHDTAIVEKHQTGLIKELEKIKINVIPLQYRHGRTLGGAWHCITLDTHREGSLESYF